MSDDSKKKRTPVIIGGTPSNPAKATTYAQGIRPLDVRKMLAQATPDQLSFLMRDNLALWAQYSGIEVDQRAFDFDHHRYLLPIYMCNAQEMSWMKSAQMGATIYEVLRLLWFCRYHQVKAALYFPTADGVTKLAKDRLNPIIKSNKELEDNLSDGDALGLKHIQNIHGRSSSLYMLYLGGTASKDSVPLDVLGFDEVRLCDTNDIDQALERVSHSTYKYRMYVSTAGYPNLDIHARFLRGNQQYWHVKCNCLDGFIPSECFPDCIIETKKREVFLRCPKCKMIVRDPQNGNYVAHNPGADFPSFHISQFISKFITPKEIWTHYNTAINKKEFYNAKLGKPFVDEENVPITEEVLENSVNTDIRWLHDAHRKDRRNCAMGIDQHGGNVFVVIAQRANDGTKRIVHMEIVDSANPRYWENGKQVSPFKRVYELFREFDVGMCVIDAMPNYNEAAQLTRDFRGRCFVAWYGGQEQKDIALWHDRARVKEGIRKGSQNIKTKFQVSLNRYTSIDYALSEFVSRNVEMPHPDALVQVARSKEGRWEADNICRTTFWLHLKSIVRQKTWIDEQTGRYRMEWAYLGRDPHFVHAWNYCNIALERLKRQAIFVI